MEKDEAHCPLSKVKALIAAGHYSSTSTALKGAAALGFDLDGMIDIIKTLRTGDFDKSMTTDADDEVWQDVYIKSTDICDLYIKLTVVGNLLIVSFKEQYS